MVVSLRKLYCMWSCFFDFYVSVFRLINNFLLLCLGSRFFTDRNQKLEMNFYSREESFEQLIVSRSEVSGELFDIFPRSSRACNGKTIRRRYERACLLVHGK